MENQWNKSRNSEYTRRDVLRNSAADDISTENIDSARTERLIEKINRLCKCAACFFVYVEPARFVENGMVTEAACDIFDNRGRNGI